ncbi:MAG: universal stress protein [Thermoplasmata archaeon]|nr:MAG: universal stress protein [Thermoplasmata archaeon]
MFRKILIPTDFSKGAEVAIKKFIRENEMEVKEIVLLHVVDYNIIDTLVNGKELLYESEEEETKDIERKLIDESKKKLNEIKESVKKIAGNTKIIVRVGIPYEEIIKIAEEENVSLIILPSHGKLNFSHEIFGSTTMRVLKKTKKAVLLIKSFEG